VPANRSLVADYTAHPGTGKGDRAKAVAVMRATESPVRRPEAAVAALMKARRAFFSLGGPRPAVIDRRLRRIERWAANKRQIGRRVCSSVQRKSLLQPTHHHFSV
jgi:hypothetical protein